MLYRKRVISLLFLILVFLFFISCVSAADHTVSGSTFEDIKDSIDISNNGDRILLGNKTYSGSGSFIRIVNKSNITVQGQSDSQHAVLDAHHLSRIIGVDENSTVTFRFIDFINGDSGIGGGSAILAHGTIVVENCNFRNNWGESGGAIFIRPGVDDCTFINCTFINNQGRYEGDDEHVEGGAIDSHGNRTIIIDCIFKGNSALTTGGAVNLARGTGYQVINCVFEDNYANFGGAIRINMGEVLIENCTFKNNIANESNGGAIDSRYADLTIKNSNFTGNTAISNGGAINDLSNSNPAYLNIINCNFINNKASNGGGIYSQNPLNITDSNFNNNRADTGNSGGVYSAKAILIQNSNFISNIGRGLVLSGDGTIISGNNFTGNTEHAIRSTNLQNAIINNNRVINNGGTGLYITGNRNAVYNNVFIGNNIGVNVNGNYTNFTSNIVNNSNSNGVVLTGIETIISSNNFTGNSENAIRSTNLQNAIISNNRVINNGGTGLYITGNSNMVYSNVFSGNNVGVNVNGDYSNFTSNVVSNSDSNGVVLTGYGVTFVNNNVSNNKGHGLVLNGNNPNIRSNHFVANGNHGIYSQLMNNAAVTNNVFLNNGGHGFYSTMFNNGVITNNSFSNNKGTGFYTKGNNNKFFSNNFTLNNVGINIVGNGTNFKDNNVAYNLLEGVIFLGNYVYVTYNNFTGNKRNAVEIKGKNTVFDYNNVKNNSINSTGNCVVLITGNNAKVRYNNIKDNNFHGIHLYGDNSQVSYNNLSNNVGIELIVQGNKAKITNNNVSKGKGNGISVNGNDNKILNNTVSNCKNNGVYVKGNKNHIIENRINSNSGKGLIIEGKNLTISYNLVYKNLKNGIWANSNNSLIKGNLIYENSKKQKFAGIYFKGNNNNFQYNIIQHNGFYGLQIKGDKNLVIRTPIFKNKYTQLIVEGNRNRLAYLTIEGGNKSGLLIKGNYNRLNNTQISYNKRNGIIITGSKNILIKNSIQKNNIGVYAKGTKNLLEQNIIAFNSRYGIYHEKGKGNYYNYNYIVNNKAKYNLYRVSGSINANYNWWGKNNLKTVKNLKVKRYVIAILVAPNILKVNKKYNVGVKFQSNAYKKLKKKIPNLIVYFGFKGGHINPKYRVVTNHVAKAKIKMNKHKAINFVAQVDNQLLYKQYVPYNGKLYEYNLYVKIIMEKIRRYNEWVRKQNAIIKEKEHWTNVTANIFNLSANLNKYSMSAMGKDYAKSTSIIIKPAKIAGPKTYAPGVADVSPYLNFHDGMIARNMPDGTFTKLFYDVAVKANIKDPWVYYSLYVVGKFSDALQYSNGDINKFFSYSFINIYGYSNFDNYGLLGQAGKATLDFALGIDEKGNMSMGDLALNILSIALGLGVGGLIGKGAKNLTKAIMKKIPAKFRTEATKIVQKFVNLIGKFTDKTPISKISVSSLKDNVVDIAKILTGDLTPIIKKIPTSSKPLKTFFENSKKIDTTVKGILDLSKGDLKGALKILNTNLKTMSGLLKNNEVKKYLNTIVRTSEAKRDLNAIIKLINEGPYDIEKAYTDLKKGSQNGDLKAKYTIKKYTNALKTLEKLLKLKGLI